MRLQFTRQITCRHRIVGCRDEQPLDDVLQLPDVAGPAVSVMDLHRVGCKRDAAGVAALLTELLQEVIDELGNVHSAVAQRRDVQVDDVQPVEKILSELPLIDQLPPSTIKSQRIAPTLTTQPRQIHASLPQLFSCQKPRPGTLHPEGHFADFIEEDRSLMGHLELAWLAPIRAGEAPLHVAESSTRAAFPAARRSSRPRSRCSAAARRSAQHQRQLLSRRRFRR